VNKVWRDALRNIEGIRMQRKFMDLAYEYREAIRNKNWEGIEKPIEEYRVIREKLCEHYMSPGAHEINEVCKNHGAVCFPLGGGGGSVMVYSNNPEILLKIRKILEGKFKLINYNISDEGHKFVNMENF